MIKQDMSATMYDKFSYKFTGYIRTTAPYKLIGFIGSILKVKNCRHSNLALMVKKSTNIISRIEHVRRL